MDKTFVNEAVLLSFRSDALLVLHSMVKRVEQHGYVSVSDLHDLVGLTGNFEDTKWGWTDLTEAKVISKRSGAHNETLCWTITFPDPVRQPETCPSCSQVIRS